MRGKRVLTKSRDAVVLFLLQDCFYGQEARGHLLNLPHIRCREEAGLMEGW